MTNETRTSRWAIGVMLLLLVSMLVGGCGHQQFKSAMFQMGDQDGWGPNALAWNGKYLIMGEGGLIITASDIELGTFFSASSYYNTDGFYYFNHDTAYVPGGVNICGIAVEGECCGRGFLWVADSSKREILKIARAQGIVKRIPTPGDSPRGLSFDGQDLWIADTKTSKIYKISTRDGRVLSEYNSPVKKPTGLAWDCGNIWVLGIDSCRNVVPDCSTPRLVKLDTASGRITREVSLPSVIKRPTAVVFAEGYLWVSDYNLNRIFQVSGSGREIEDNALYVSAITVKQKESRNVPVEVKEPVQANEINDTRYRDEARAAAADARKSADEAKEAADQAKKAFELEQKK